MITIKNNTRYHKSGVTKVFLQVPNYNSSVARNNRAQDLSLRLASEIKRYNDAGGCNIFVTFTYDDEHLPRYFYLDENDAVRSFPCFSKEDKDTYLNSLRVYLYRHFPKFKQSFVTTETDVPEELPFRYCWASEFGTSRTHRSHYHTIFNIPPLIHQEMLRMYGEVGVVGAYKHLFSRFWDKGFVLWSDQNKDKTKRYPIFVQSDFAARYTSKYCMKEMRFWSNPDFQHYYDLYKNVKDEIIEVKKFLPFHHTSNHVGEALTKEYNTAADFSDGVHLESQADTQHGISKKYKAPLYIQRKKLMVYDRDEERYKFTEFGKRIRLEQFVNSFEKKCKDLTLNTSAQALYKKLDSYEVDRLFGERYNIHDINDLVSYITLILGNSVQNFVLYNLSWRGREFHEDPEVMQEVLASLSPQEFYDYSIDLYCKSLDQDSYDKYVEDGYFKHFDVLNIYDMLPCFAGYNEVSNILSEINEFHCKKIILRFEEDRERRKNTKFAVV